MPPDIPLSLALGLTVSDVAKRYRVSPDKIRAWIRTGELRAVSTAATRCGRPRWVVTAEALLEWERRRQVAPPSPAPRRRRRPVGAVDFYPD